MRILVQRDYSRISLATAAIISGVIRDKPDAVLGLATGSSPIGTYNELIKMNREGAVDFSKIRTFNLDEFVAMRPDHEQSYRRFIDENLFDHVNIRHENINVPDGMSQSINDFCGRYDRKIAAAGGIDLQVLGIGQNGRIGFNEPGSSLGSVTRVKTLSSRTRRENADFFGSIDEVPEYAITMGMGIIMKARRIIVLANGLPKAEAIRAACEGPVTSMCPASVFQLHPDVTYIIDIPAASKLEYDHETPEDPADLPF